MSQIFKPESGSPSPGDIETLTGDSGGPVGPDGAGNIDILGQPDINVAGDPGTSTLTLTDLTKLSPFVVDGSGIAGVTVAYTTLQSAINAANAAGGGVVYIYSGTYTENLTLFDNVDLWGITAVSQNQGVSVSIVGTHTPPNTGHIGFNSICFISTTDVFSSVAAGSTHIVFLNCESAVQNGYFLNLPNWTGTLEIFDNNPATAGAPFAVNDGGINNTGGSTLFAFAAGIGFGTNTMTLSGVVFGEGLNFTCPLDFTTGSNITLDDCQFVGNVTFSGNSTGAISNSRFTGGASAAITMNSSAAISIVDSNFDSSNAVPIGGNGAGNLTLLNITPVTNQQIGGDVITPNLNYAIRGNGSTVGAGTADLITWTMPNVSAVIVFDIRAVGFESTTPAGNGYNVFGTVRTDGVTATVVGTPDKIINEEAALFGSDLNLVVSGNNAIVQATGIALLTINWNVFANFSQVR